MTSEDRLPDDAWLREALRHAPDAHITPPQALREAILRQARAQARPGWRERVLAWWDALARPPVAAGLASLMISAVLGVLWWRGELDEAPPPQAAPERMEAPVAAAPPAPRAAAAPPAARPLAKAAPANEHKSEAPQLQEQVARPDAAAVERRKLADLAQAQPSADATRQRDLGASLAASAALPATAPAFNDPLPWLIAQAGPRAAPLHWTWGGRTHPQGDAQRAWFDELRSATAGRWQRTTGAPLQGDVLQVHEGPALRGEIVLADDRVVVLSPTFGQWQAMLDGPVAARLRATAARW